jgi:hypothetical protein
VSDWQVIAFVAMTVALAVVTITQIVMAVAAMKVAREASEAVRDLRRDMAPILEKVNKIADDAAMASALVVRQVERIDQLVETTTGRLEDTIVTVQQSVLGPVRTGAAFLGALRAALSAFGGRGRRAAGPDDEDALFVG